jgi:hypothetical protein
MSTFTVASFSANANNKSRGQSFVANAAGPNGTGGPGTANPVFVQSASVGYPTANTLGRASAAYLYDTVPTKTDLNAGTGALFVSTSHTDENLFGTGTYSRTFVFGGASIDPTKTYYLLFPSDQNLRYDNTDPYPSGSFYDTSLQAANFTAQFQVSLTDV